MCVCAVGAWPETQMHLELNGRWNNASRNGKTEDTSHLNAMPISQNVQNIVDECLLGWSHTQTFTNENIQSKRATEYYT